MEPRQRVILRPAEPGRDFGELATLFTSLEDEPATEAGLLAFYEKEKERVLQAVAEEERGSLPGFYWAEKERAAPEHVFFYLYVKPERRGQGIGGQLYAEMFRALEAGGPRGCASPSGTTAPKAWHSPGGAASVSGGTRLG